MQSLIFSLCLCGKTKKLSKKRSFKQFHAPFDLTFLLPHLRRGSGASFYIQTFCSSTSTINQFQTKRLHAKAQRKRSEAKTFHNFKNFFAPLREIKKLFNNRRGEAHHEKQKLPKMRSLLLILNY
jgi:hypothetical protein